MWSGEELLLVLPETDPAGVKGFAVKLERALNDLDIRRGTEDGGRVSVDVRVANWRTGDDADALLKRLSLRHPS